MAVDSIKLGRNPNLAPRCRRAAPPHLPPNRSLVEHRRNSAVPLECTPSRASHQGGPPTDREPEGRSPAVASPRHHPPLPPSKQNEFPTSLRFFRRRWHPKWTTVARDRRNSDELGQPAREHRRSGRWCCRPLPNLICTVHHKPSG
jgi:hypothetical protein